MSASLRGRVLDVHRFSLHDGPGIRTAVFLKGCPLRCVWCHNPESRASEPQLAFFAERCVACGECVAACLRGAHRFVDGRHEIDRAACEGCGRCVDACALDALRLAGRDRCAGEVIDLVERDRAFYAASGGGLTITGGEPLAQAEFTRALLSEARRRGIRTCVETSGAAPWSAIDSIRELVDLFLFDLKATGEDLHRGLTGAAPGPILANLERLLAAGAAVRLRCPLVPGVNDDDAHLRAIAAIATRHPAVVIEPLRYHDTARHKLARYGLEGPPGPWPAAGEADHRRWCETLRRLGCARVLEAGGDDRRTA